MALILGQPELLGAAFEVMVSERISVLPSLSLAGNAWAAGIQEEVQQSTPNHQ